MPDGLVLLQRLVVGVGVGLPRDAIPVPLVLELTDAFQVELGVAVVLD